MRRFISLLIIILMACPALVGQASDKSETPPARAYLVGNAHFDSQWRWTVQRSINEFIPNTLYQNFHLFEEFPEYIFNFEGGMKYQWIREYYPREYELLKKYVAEGRWHISGSSWDANDTNLPSVESTFRNILLAQTFYQNEFGRKSTDIMLPDCFGFSYTMPAVASHCGLIGFSTQKLTWRHKPLYPGGEKFPFQFGLWRGVDGSVIFAAPDGGGYGWNPSEDLTQSKELTSRIKASAVNAAYRYFGTRSSELRGDRGGSPLPRTVRNIRKAIRKGGDFEIKISASDDIFKDYAHLKDSLPVYDGEMLMDVHATGCYTSQADMKRLNRRNEQLAYAAEASSVMAHWMRVMPYQQYTLLDAWKRFIWHQFHDDLTGTSIPEAYTFSWNDEIISQRQFSAVIESSVAAAASQLNTSSVKGLPVVVYNPLAVHNNDIVTVDIQIPEGCTAVEVYSPSGRKLRSQIQCIKGNTATVSFASDAAPASLSVYDLRPVKKASAPLDSKTADNQIENSVYKVRVDSKGDIVSIWDKRYGRELVAEGSYIGLAVFEENTSDRWPAWEILKQVIDKEPVAVAESVSVYVESSGPLMKVLNVTKKYGNSTFVQRIILTQGAQDDRIDIETYADWNSQRTLLKAQFPLTVASEKATYDLGLGTISRGNNTEISYEVPAYQWADLSSGDYGVTIMSDSKYGWDKPSDNCLRLTLLHTPTADFDWFPHQKTQDIGRHCFKYSIVGHNGAVVPHEASLKADMLNNRKLAFVTQKHKGSLGRTFSMVSLSCDKVQMECLKLAEDGKDYIIRVYECSGNDLEDVSITFPAKITCATQVNGIEEYIEDARYEGNSLHFDIGRYSPKTFRVRLAAPDMPAPETEKFHFLKLPYNSMTITGDAFCAVGNMDELWNSYAAELIPDTLQYRGVPFVFAEANYANAVKCSGQKVSVPESVDGVYLLVASTDGERSASFASGNMSMEAAVPYYTGFVGQCRYADYYDAPYVRTGDIAYVGTHRHNPYVCNEPYVFTYMYMIYVPVDAGAGEIRLPDDKNVTVFSATAVSGRLPEAKSISEMVSRIF